MTDNLSQEAQSPKKFRLLIIIGVSLFGILLIFGSYMFLKKFLSDRQRVSGFSTRPNRVRHTVKGPNQNSKTYTPEELEKARENGTLPPGMKQMPLPPTQLPTDHIQRSMRTLDEINRINRMNQQLMEQQQRMNNR